MAYCFYEHGMLPKDYIKLDNKDKALMLAAINYFTEKNKKSNSSIGNKESLI